MLIESKLVLDILEKKKMFYLNQGRYTQAEVFKEAIKDVLSLERSAHENSGGVHPKPPER